MATKTTTKKKGAAKETPKNKNLKSLLLILVLLVATYLLSSQLIFKDSKKPVSSKPSVKTSEKTKSTGLTAAEVATHSTAADCYLIIDKKVYNATELADKHSGGAKNVTNYCGKDASTAWNTKNKAVAKVHSAAAKALLAKNLVGDLK